MGRTGTPVIWGGLALAGIVAIAVTACGGQSDEDTARETVTDYFGALIEADGDAACDRLTGGAERRAVDGLRELLPEAGPDESPDSCPILIRTAALRIGAGRAAEIRSLVDDEEIVRSVEVDGASATVVAAIGSQEAEVPLKRVGDEWSISELGPPVGTVGSVPPAPPLTETAPASKDAWEPSWIANSRAEVTRRALEDAGYRVREGGVGSSKGTAALTVPIGDGGRVAIYAYETKADAITVMRELRFAERPRLDSRMEVARSGPLVFVGTIKQPATLPVDEFNAVVEVAAREA